ncbi:hypothetical protein ACET3X_002207 [Alternaria dauci]|uniref:Prion-inhibition and propagation HeLo domain-containing protein n=1 Tax=Alternaria dauci TaxID=48095 RepID=A0ABR3UQ58_9PLEO
MEVAGLAVGTLALVGVFEDCVTLFSQIGVAASMEKDYMLLATRLDLQKALLLQWAERMKIYDEGLRDPRLSDPMIESLVFRTLDCIRKLLEDGNVLQMRYGVGQADVKEKVEPSTAASSRLMSRMRNNSLALRLRRDVTACPSDQSNSLHQPSGGNHRAKRRRSDVESLMPHQEALHQQRPYKKLDNKKLQIDLQTLQHRQMPVNNGREKLPSLDKVKWVIKDKEKFDNLVRELSAMITDIDKLVPPQGGDDTKHTILGHDFQTLKSIRELKKIMHASVMDNSELVSITERAIDRACSELILNRLWFRLIDDRERNIADAHSKTLEWSIQPPTPQVVWDDLGQWFRSGRDIYWIHGKPGSGKSTLMKFLYHHPKVMSYLQQWAGDRKLTVASFFLWNVGTLEQSSQEGLARGLLYHVLKQNQELIPAVLPYMWIEAQNGRVDPLIPSESGMKAAFQRIAQETTTGAFAFFIDGLDEFTGNHRDGISFVKSLTASANIKILVSSRPIDTCVAAFSSAPQLRLQDLTVPDIEKYIKDVIQSHPYVAETGCLDDVTVDRLMADVQSKASGVFLWVVLACRTLIEGFEAYDNAEELRRRVDELPPELESLFRHILNSLPPRFLQQAAKLLALCYTSHKLKPQSDISALALAWAHENDMNMRAIEHFERWSSQKRQQKIQMLEGRLRSRCRGLLEIHPSSIMAYRVDFMHRTVYEYLSTPDVWDMDCLQVNDHHFDAVNVLAYMSSYTLYAGWTNGNGHDYRVGEAALDLETVEKCSTADVLIILESLAASLMRDEGVRFPFAVFAWCEMSVNDAAVLLALEFNLTGFITKYDIRAFNTRQKLHYQSDRRQYLLHHALVKPILYGDTSPKHAIRPSVTIVHHLIQSGCDPSESITVLGGETTSAWKIWMSSSRGIAWRQDRRDRFTTLEDLQLAEVTVIMIRAGVDISQNTTQLLDQCKEWSKRSIKMPSQVKSLEAFCNEIRQAVKSRSHDIVCNHASG